MRRGKVAGAAYARVVGVKLGAVNPTYRLASVHAPDEAETSQPMCALLPVAISSSK